MRRRVRTGCCLLVAVLLASCSGPHPPARVPFSAASGLEGGAEDTLYYDVAGNPHFQG